MSQKEIKTGKFEPFEDTFIKTEYKVRNDADIAHELNRKEDAIVRRRKALGLSKEKRTYNNFEKQKRR